MIILPLYTLPFYSLSCKYSVLFLGFTKILCFYRHDQVCEEVGAGQRDEMSLSSSYLITDLVIILVNTFHFNTSLAEDSIDTLGDYEKTNRH